MSLSSLSRRAHAAATLMYYLHPHSLVDGSTPPKNFYFVEQFEIQESHWYLPAVAEVFNKKIIAGEEHAMDIIGQLINLTSDKFLARQALNHSIQAWREIASAPLKKAHQAST